MSSIASTGAMRHRQQRPFLGLIVLFLAGLWAPHQLLCGRAFVGDALRSRRPLQHGRQPSPTVSKASDMQTLIPEKEEGMGGLVSGLGGMQEFAAAPKEEEMSDFDKFIDRWNTKGGAILITFIGFIVIWAFEKVLELAGVESIKAGIWTSGFFSIGLLAWTVQYFTRVAGKSTTYAQQLFDYEREVTIRRIQELDDEEIQALCEETGVTQEAIDAALGESQEVKGLTQKEKVIALYKSVPYMPGSPMGQDPRGMLG